MNRLIAIAALFLPTLVSCSDIPENPTWFGEVQGILRANCARCHGAPARNGAPTSFRLDRYVANDGDDAAPDAYDMRDSVIRRAVDFLEVDQTPMPPDSHLSFDQQDILGRWLDNGAPKGVRDNQVPQATLIEPSQPPASIDQELSLRFRSFDADRDGLLVALGVRAPGSAAAPNLLAEALPGGTVDLVVDTGQLASMQRFDFVALVDDGFSDEPAENKTAVVLLSDVLIDHGDRGTAPTVRLDGPNGGAAVLGPTDITWTASDPDEGDVLSIDLDLVRLDASGNEASTESLATGLPNSPSTFSWDPSGVAATDDNGDDIDYKIRVTASDTDNKNTRSDESDEAFTVVMGATVTDLSWDSDIKPLLVTYCKACHGQPPVNPFLDYFRLDKYDAADTEAPTNDDQGVFEMRDRIYMRLLTQGNMPPASQPQPGDAEKAQIAEWIQAGAPFDGSSPDLAPTFTWTTPNDSATTDTGGSPDVTLQWTASDPEAMPLTGNIEMAEIAGAGNPNVVSCDASVTGWVEVVSAANIEDGSFALTLPNPGKFCFKGSVTDAAGQSTTVVSSFGIKF